ncbi:MAG: type I DNA topoisomerase [Anaerolineae bacterium]|nr:type I DNA topoisomerase [Anaerolineae bacterium]
MQEPVIGYCVKCREKRPIASVQAVFLGESQRPATQGVCPECGTKIVRFGKTAAHQGLDPEAHTVLSKATKERQRSGPKMVIVESPAKARTVGRFLGRGYTVEASVGHIRDLPSNRMGVDIEHDFRPRYVIPAKKQDVVKRLKAKASKASEVYLATDPDREGEAIAWHLEAALRRELRGIAVHRVEFHEITKQAVDQAFSQPRDIDRLRVDSQQARRILDRVVGYSLSPLLRDKMGRRGLSAGRVQSVALRLICEREREIEAFVPVEYWTIEAELRQQQAASEEERKSFIARLFKIRGQDPDLKNEGDAQAIVEDLEGAVYVVEKVTRRERRRNPAPPFTTSTLQQEASRKLRFTAKRTMAVAQALYEGKDIGDGERVGLITYMRTDSVNVSEAAQAEAREVIQARFGQEYLPAHPPKYKTRAKGAQEAHEAIRPTSSLRDPDSLKAFLSRDELRLYTLIWERFIASQMAPAILDQTSVDILAGPPAGEKPYLFRATGSIVKFAGFLKVYEEGREEEEEEEEGTGIQLPALRKGEELDLVRLLPKQHFTQPPPRYTDASLIRTLEEYGIGRPSTYAPTLSTLLQRRYIGREGKKLIPTKLGFTVNDLLVEFFPDVVNVGFTAEMEEKLDEIATGEVSWVPMLREFYGPFSARLEVAQDKMPQLEFKPEPTGEMCPECGKPLLIRDGRYGKFIGCSGWPACRHTEPIPLPGVACPQCGGAVVEKRTRRGRRFWGCVNYRADDETSCQWASWTKPAPATEDGESSTED